MGLWFQRRNNNEFAVAARSVRSGARTCLLPFCYPTVWDEPTQGGTRHVSSQCSTRAAAVRSTSKRRTSCGSPLNEDRPPFAFAGIWTEFKGDRGTKSKPIPGPHLVYGFMTTAPNAIGHGILMQYGSRPKFFTADRLRRCFGYRAEAPSQRSEHFCAG